MGGGATSSQDGLASSLELCASESEGITASAGTGVDSAIVLHDELTLLPLDGHWQHDPEPDPAFLSLLQLRAPRLQTRPQLRSQSVVLAPASTPWPASCSPRPPHHDMPSLSGLPQPQPLSLPAFYSPVRTNADQRPRTSPSPSRSRRPPLKLTPTTSTPTLRSQPSTSPQRSPQRSPSQKRKPPASHSSYGVETSLGPPPSYSTQRTLSEDRVRGVNRALTSAPSERVGQLQSNAGSTKSPQGQPHNTSSTADRLAALPLAGLHTSDPEISSPDSAEAGSDMSSPTSAGGTNGQDDTEASSSGPGLGLDGTHDDAKASSSDETQKSEDLFLNIAKADTGSKAKATMQRSRISLPLLSSSRPPTSGGVRSSAMTGHFDHELLTPHPEALRPGAKRSSLGHHVPSALASTPYFDNSRSQVGRNVDERSQIGSHVGSVYDRSETRARSSYVDRFRPAEQPATESTISTTAPSTVWDELDDLKSRIRKLELTGKLPPSSAAAMGTAERPRTATTQATTMSSSPKHKAAVSTLASQIEGIPSTIHPLLHEALSSAKAVVSHEVYQKLQATAQDALQLSAMMISHEAYSSTASGGALVNERQIRRRTESMCRSLTELVISLLADQRSGSSPSLRPASRDALSQPGSGLRSRRLSNEQPDRAAAASRVQSRLESRRSSLNTQFQSSSPAHPPSAYATPTAPAPLVSQSASKSASTRMHRTSVAARSLLRPVSRAHTEISATSSSTHRALARDRAHFSREYTKQHPLPTSPAVVRAPAVSVGRTPLPSNVSFISRRLSTNHTTPQSAPAPQTQNIFHRRPSDESPIGPSQRPPFTISIERRNPAANLHSIVNSPAEASPTALPQTPDSVHSTSTPRQPLARRSLGFTSKFSSVSSRLKAARAERLASASASRLPPKKPDDGGSNADNRQALAVSRMGPERTGSIGASEWFSVVLDAFCLPAPRLETRRGEAEHSKTRLRKEEDGR
ncbi:hypothetical protein DV736_g1355, partial [Chaetothyriales sp. CBS 134916]